jgi:hypothetical protein
MAAQNVGSAAFPAGTAFAAAALLLGAFLFASHEARSHAAVPHGAPQTLAETGLYADADDFVVDPRNLHFSPQYQLWTDGATKNRWIRLPPGGVIDASDPDAWMFPVGTRFWKEFSFAGRLVETRYMELQANGQWLYAAYEWTPDGREAVLAPDRGRGNAFAFAGRQSHDIPSTSDCKVCHQGGPAEVLGFSALQLSPDRDPNALRAVFSTSDVDVDTLIENGLIMGVDTWPSRAPVIETASATERAALGYMHGNCGHCHNSRAKLANLGLFLRQEMRTPDNDALATTVGQLVKKSAPGQSADALLRIDPGHPPRSAIFERVSSRYPALQMPPLGTVLVDDDAVALLAKWIVDLKTTNDR